MAQLNDMYIRFECGTEGRASIEYGPFPFVQMTYQYLRVGPEGEHFAEFDPENDEWVPYAENPAAQEVTKVGEWTQTVLKPKSEDRVWYSDVCIFSKEASANA